MSKQTKDKQVLLAILNVKKYAKKLKKNASNLPQLNDDQFNQAISSPSFFQNRHQQYDTISSRDFMEPNSPLLATKSSYNQSFQNGNRQKKQHSMTYIPGSRKIERQHRKNSDVIVYQPTSPAKTYTSSRQQLSQSYKVQVVGPKIVNEGNWKKQHKDHLITFQRKKSHQQKQIQSQVNLQQFNQTISLPINKMKQTPIRDLSTKLPTASQNPKLTLQFLEQISCLKQKINLYKNALILIRTKYLQLQQKIKNKAQTDHHIDILQQKIQKLQQQKSQLNQTILKQNNKIAEFDNYIIEISYKFTQYYKDKLSFLVQLQTQNKIYRQLLQLKSIEHLQKQIQHYQQNKINQITQQQQQQLKLYKNGKTMNKIKNNSQSQSQNQIYEQQLRISINNICKKQKDIADKYNYNLIAQ